MAMIVTNLRGYDQSEWKKRIHLADLKILIEGFAAVVFSSL